MLHLILWLCVPHCVQKAYQTTAGMHFCHAALEPKPTTDLRTYNPMMGAKPDTPCSTSNTTDTTINDCNWLIFVKSHIFNYEFKLKLVKIKYFLKKIL